MKQFQVIKELSSTHPNAKPVIVEVDQNGCWRCVNHRKTETGYIHLRRNGKLLRGHRLSYETFVGEIPKDLYVLHKCDVRDCINPEHLFLGTCQDNQTDMVQKGRSTAGTKHPKGCGNMN
ncbi:MAG: hypothetical protein GTO02_08825 [Candidatus Dadabacteria bacterium]|nr:hypothetical protein [Candidatus Dadabacteria bacterium]